MQRIVMTTHFVGEAEAPSGAPPQTDPRASSVSLEAVMADGSAAGIDRASYENHAVFTSESTFAETGTISYDDGAGVLEIATQSDGTLGPSAEPDVLHGAAVYRITAGGGRFAQATGLVTTNFLLWPATGRFEERQAAIVFVP
ncbi:MAG TPA: hypothetical protein VF080_02290 [Solirubrobacteraceae bacterium]